MESSPCRVEQVDPIIEKFGDGGTIGADAALLDLALHLGGKGARLGVAVKVLGALSAICVSAFTPNHLIDDAVVAEDHSFDRCHHALRIVREGAAAHAAELRVASVEFEPRPAVAAGAHLGFAVEAVSGGEHHVAGERLDPQDIRAARLRIGSRLKLAQPVGAKLIAPQALGLGPAGGVNVADTFLIRRRPGLGEARQRLDRPVGGAGFGDFGGWLSEAAPGPY